MNRYNITWESNHNVKYRIHNKILERYHTYFKDWVDIKLTIEDALKDCPAVFYDNFHKAYKLAKFKEDLETLLK